MDSLWSDTPAGGRPGFAGCARRYLNLLMLVMCCGCATHGTIVQPPDGRPLISKHQYVVYRDPAPDLSTVFINGVRARQLTADYSAWVRLLPGTNLIVVTARQTRGTTLLAGQTAVYAPAPEFDAPLGDGDGDGIINELDRFPFDPRFSLDTNGDGIGEPWMGRAAEARVFQSLVDAGVNPEGIIMEYGVVLELELDAPTDAQLALLRGLGLRRLSITNGEQVQDLASLAGLPLEALTLSQCGITCLAPLRGMRLNELSLTFCPGVHDLAPLHGMPLHALDISFTSVSNLAPLAGMSLRVLEMNDVPVRDLSPLRGMPLQALGCYGCLFTDLTPLKGAPLLSLDLNRAPVADLSPLVGMPLRKLSMDGTRVKDLAPLRGLPLEYLSVNQSIVSDGWEVLREIPTLKQINHMATAAFWRELPALQRKALIRLRVTELLTPYEGGGNALRIPSDISVDRPSLRGRPVRDLRPLQGLPLTALDLADTSVTDLTPLHGMPLRELDLRGTAVRDLAPLRGMPLEELVLPRATITNGMDILRQTPTLRLIDGYAPETFFTMQDTMQDIGLLPVLEFFKAQSPHWGYHSMPFELQTNGTFSLRLSAPGISNLPPMGHLPVSELDLQYIRVTDLSPLIGAPLERLSLRDTPVQNLDALRHMPLRDLDLSRSQVTNLNGLHGLALERLALHGLAIDDIGPLRGMPLQVLDLSGTLVSDLSTLAGMPLRDLDLSGTPAAELTALRGMPLTSLLLSNTPVQDLSPLAGMPLEVLSLMQTRVARLDPLRGMPLGSLNLRHTPVTDLTPLAGMNIRYLSCDETNIVTGDSVLAAHTTVVVRALSTPEASASAVQKQLAAAGIPCYVENGKRITIRGNVTDLSPLAGLPIVELSLRGTLVSDLGPLRGLPLKRLSISQTRVSDLSPLRDMPLNYLSAERLTLEDLTPLMGMPLLTLKLSHSRVTDFSPLAGLPLETLDIDAHSAASGLDTLRAISSLKMINSRPTAQFWKDYDASR